MKTIKNLSDLVRNIQSLEYYLNSGDEFERTESIKLIKNGTCYVVYELNGQLRFAPSRYLGYFENNIQKHTYSPDKDGKVTNPLINRILKPVKLVQDHELERAYKEYCLSLGFTPHKTGAYGAPRKYWHLQNDISDTISDTSCEFPEGRLIEIQHKSRERNTLVVKLAKDNFKKLHGSLYCEVCGFDFENVYGEIGKGFIEAHHTIAVSEMAADHKTKIEDIVLLCSNCHSMVHKRRPWLGMKDLKKLIVSRKLDDLNI